MEHGEVARLALTFRLAAQILDDPGREEICLDVDPRTHAGWTTEKEAKKHEAGWIGILGLLKSELETGDISGKTKLLYRIQGLFMFAMPKTTTTEYADEQGW